MRFRCTTLLAIGVTLLVVRTPQAAATERLFCDDYNLNRYEVFVSQTPMFTGRLVIAPAQYVGPAPLPLTSYQDPAVAMAFFAPWKGALYIAINGSLVLSEGPGTTDTPSPEAAPEAPPGFVPSGPPPGFSSSGPPPGLQPLGPPGFVVINPPPFKNGHKIGRCGVVEVSPTANPAFELPSGYFLSQGIPLTRPIEDDGRVHYPMVLASTAQAAACLQYGGDARQNCVANLLFSDSERKAIDCARSPGSGIDKAQCLTALVNPAAAQTVAMLNACVAAGGADWDCVAKKSLNQQQYAALRCVERAADQAGLSSCVQAIPLDSGTAAAIQTIAECYQGNSTAAGYATCALSRSNNQAVATAARCLADQVQGGSYLGAAVCYAGSQVHFNPEVQISVECAASTGGQPYVLAGCIGGRLTARELEKCVTQGIGGEGCFGPNNEIVKDLRFIGLDTGNLMNPNGEVIKAWNTATHDLVYGLGPNNDIIRIARQPGQALQSIDSQISRAVSDVARGAARAPSDVINWARARLGL